MRRVLLTVLVAVSLAGAVRYTYDEYSYEADAKDDFEDARPEYKLEDAPRLFKEFIKNYNKQYDSDAEYKERYHIFLDNLKYIINENKKGGPTVLDINFLADRNDEEIEDWS